MGQMAGGVWAAAEDEASRAQGGAATGESASGRVLGLMAADRRGAAEGLQGGGTCDSVVACWRSYQSACCLARACAGCSAAGAIRCQDHSSMAEQEPGNFIPDVAEPDGGAAQTGESRREGSAAAHPSSTGGCMGQMAGGVWAAAEDEASRAQGGAATGESASGRVLGLMAADRRGAAEGFESGGQGYFAMAMWYFDQTFGMLVSLFSDAVPVGAISQQGGAANDPEFCQIYV